MTLGEVGKNTKSQDENVPCAKGNYVFQNKVFL